MVGGDPIVGEYDGANAIAGGIDLDADGVVDSTADNLGRFDTVGENVALDAGDFKIITDTKENQFGHWMTEAYVETGGGGSVHMEANSNNLNINGQSVDIASLPQSSETFNPNATGGEVTDSAIPAGGGQPVGNSTVFAMKDTEGNNVVVIDNGEFRTAIQVDGVADKFDNAGNRVNYEGGQHWLNIYVTDKKDVQTDDYGGYLGDVLDGQAVDPGTGKVTYDPHTTQYGADMPDMPEGFFRMDNKDA